MENSTFFKRYTTLIALFFVIGITTSTLAQSSKKEITLKIENSLVNIKKANISFQKNELKNVSSKNRQQIIIEKSNSPMIITNPNERENSTNNAVINNIGTIKKAAIKKAISNKIEQ